MPFTENSKKVSRLLSLWKLIAYTSSLAEIAKSIYANISQEKMDLIGYLRRNEEMRMLEQEQVQEYLQVRIQVSLKGQAMYSNINEDEKDLGNLQESTKQQHDTLAALISRSSYSADQAHKRLLQTILEMRNVGEGWWEEVQLRAQEQVELDAANARRLMDVELAGMRSLVSILNNWQ